MSRPTETRRTSFSSLLVVGLAVSLAAIATIAAMLPSQMTAFAQTTATPNPSAASAPTTNGKTTSQFPGNISLVQGAEDFLNNNLNASLVDAMTTAEGAIQNSTSIGGHFSILQNSLVYNVTVAYVGNNTAFNVFVDPANGNVLSKTAAIPLSTLGLPAGFENATTILVDAAGTAEDQVQNGMTIAASIEGAQQGGGAGGAIIYDFTVADTANGTLHKIKIDSTTGKAVSTPELVPLGQLHIGDIF
jgi:uncharacterized membrane protein YkoI